MTKYNGWTNYETWLANLWLDNDEGTQGYWSGAAQAMYDVAEADGTFTREERATLDLSDMLKSEHEESEPELGASLWSDLLRSALGEVNWHEIAEHLISDVDKTADDGPASD